MALLHKNNQLFNRKFTIYRGQRTNEIALIQILSALLIVNYHTSSLNVPVIHNFARFGFILNTVFVGLSGYLLALSTRNKRLTTEWIWRRFIRLYPPYWVALVFIVIIQYFIGQKITLTDIAIQLTGVHYFLGYDSLGRHLWFVSVIIACYFLFWPSLFFIRRKPLIFLLLLVCGFILTALLLNGTIRNIYTQISNVAIFRFFYHYIVFVLGMLIATNKMKFVTARRYNPVFLAPALLVALIPYELAKNNASYGLVAIVMAVLVAGMLCMLLVSIFPYAKGFSALFCLSSVTYEVYLIHYSCINLSGYLFKGLAAYVMTFVGTIIVAFMIRYVLILIRLQRI